MMHTPSHQMPLDIKGALDWMQAAGVMPEPAPIANYTAWAAAGYPTERTPTGMEMPTDLLVAAAIIARPTIEKFQIAVRLADDNLVLMFGRPPEEIEARKAVYYSCEAIITRLQEAFRDGNYSRVVSERLLWSAHHPQEPVRAYYHSLNPNTVAPTWWLDFWYEKPERIYHTSPLAHQSNAAIDQLPRKALSTGLIAALAGKH